MPLASGKGKSVISANIRELHHGRTFAKTKAKFGAGKAHAQAIAIAFDKARQSGKKPAMPKPVSRFRKVEDS